jgi:hypothetical protein
MPHLRKRAPVAKRIYLTGTRADTARGYEILIKDNMAGATIWRISAPSYRAGNAMVRTLREVDAAHGTVF